METRTGGGGNNIAQARAELETNSRELIRLLDTAYSWLNGPDEKSGEIRESAYDLIDSIKEDISIVSREDRSKSFKDEQLSVIAGSLSVKLMEFIHSALSIEDEPSLIFCSEATALIFLLQPYLTEVAMKKYGGPLMRSANLCKSKLISVRDGGVSVDVLTPIMTILGLFASYTYTT